MNRETYWIQREPRNEAYDELIDFCASHSRRCSFALQNPKRFSKNCARFLDELTDHLIEVLDQSEWPGTRLTSSTAPVYWFTGTPELAVEIKARVRALYAWISPDLPEDLAFYWPDGSILLGTCSHEKFAFLNLTAEEMEQFKQGVTHVHMERKSG
jgi:hypothetical protein